LKHFAVASLLALLALLTLTAKAALGWRIRLEHESAAALEKS
jgi:ABC-type sulfate transport system permease subunit